MINVGICDDEVKIAAQMENLILDVGRKENIPVNVEVFYSGKLWKRIFCKVLSMICSI